MWILTRNKTTGLYASYPDHFLDLFPDLERAEEDEPCADCGLQEIPEQKPTPSEFQLKEPTVNKRTKK